MENKKVIGIVTLHNGNNYGAVFQVFALSKYLESKGHKVFVLNYHMDRAGAGKYLRSPIKFIAKMLDKNALSINFIKEKMQGNRGKKREVKFDILFAEFRKKYLNITDAVYDYDKLTKSCPDADVYICGSDQVWAADFYFSTPAYILGFVPDHIRRVSYAPSFGKNQLEKYLHKTFATHVGKFHAISVRERSGVDVIKNVTSLEATQVLDPTLLLSDYSEILDYSLVPDHPYIFVYRLNQEYRLTKWMSESFEYLGEKMNLPIYSVSTNCTWSLNGRWKDIYPTPGQLLGLLEKSSLTLTNSFHGTVFSILFNSNFLTFARDEYEDKQNLRMTGLLEMLEISSRYCGPFLDLEEIYEKTRINVNYENVESELKKLRDDSIRFLHDALL